MCCKES